MTNQAGSSDRMTAGDSGRRPGPGWADEPAVKACYVVPIVPNLLATFAGFLALMIAPWICLQIHLAILEDAIEDDRVAALFVLASLEETAVIAVLGSLLFLVVGIILQAWQYHRPFPSRWPALLAFPIAMGLLMPEALLRGGSAVSGAVIGAALAVAFGVHWVSVVILREEMD
jgi:hypothetical protein